MKEIIRSFFRERSLVNHQLASYDDCIPSSDSRTSRMEKIVQSIRVGTDEEIDDDQGGIIKLDVIDQDIVVRLKKIQLGTPANCANVWMTTIWTSRFRFLKPRFVLQHRTSP